MRWLQKGKPTKGQGREKPRDKARTRAGSTNKETPRHIDKLTEIPERGEGRQARLNKFDLKSTYPFWARFCQSMHAASRYSRATLLLACLLACLLARSLARWLACLLACLLAAGLEDRLRTNSSLDVSLSISLSLPHPVSSFPMASKSRAEVCPTLLLRHSFAVSLACLLAC